MVTSSCSSSKRQKATARRASTSKRGNAGGERRENTTSADLEVEGFEDDSDDNVPRTNKHGIQLTKSGRPSIKKNDVNERYSTKYRNAANTETILGKLMPIGHACALIGTVMLGPDIPLEEAGHADRLRIFRSAAHYCLDEADLADILNTQPKPLELYLKGIFQAACRVLRYELFVQARSHFEQEVFKPAIKKPEIQAHLGLEMAQSVFDQYVFAYILNLCIFCRSSH